MASNISYPRKYFTVKYAQLSTIPVKAGNVISIIDSDAIYYDVPESISDIQGPAIRRKASSTKFVDGDTLPDIGEPEVVYVIQTGDYSTESGDKPVYGSYIWNTDTLAWVEISNNEHSDIVKVNADDVNRIYFTGSKIATDDREHLIKNPKVYLSPSDSGYTLNSNISGTAARATQADNATNAGIADKAKADINSNAITSYIRSVSQNGRSITFTKGDGEALPTITTVDTTYSVFNSTSDGLVSKTSSTVSSDSTSLLLTGSGWMDKSSISVGSAASTTNDGINNNIANTYIKNLELNDTTLVVTKGNGSSKSITFPISNYEVYQGDDAGLVPPNGISESKYLSGAGTWEDAPVYSVVTTSANGLVPSPTTGAQDTLFLAHAADTDSVEWLGLDTTKVTSENTTDRLYVLGAKIQIDEPTNAYTNVNVYIEDGELYGNGGKYITVDNVAALTNKTYNGYTLGVACSKDISNIVSDSETIASKLPTVSAVNTFVVDKVNTVNSQLSGKLNSLGLNIADAFGTASSYSLGDYCMHDGVLYKCNNAATSTSTFTEADWDATTVMAELMAIKRQLNP